MKFIKLIIVYFYILISINAYSLCDGICRKKDYALAVSVGTKVNWRFDRPGSHSHHTCPKEAGHWHYDILNQNPTTCLCNANGTGRTYVCGAYIPAEHNDIVWTNDDD